MGPDDTIGVAGFSTGPIDLTSATFGTVTSILSISNGIGIGNLEANVAVIDIAAGFAEPSADSPSSGPYNANVAEVGSPVLNDVLPVPGPASEIGIAGETASISEGIDEIGSVIASIPDEAGEDLITAGPAGEHPPEPTGTYCLFEAAFTAATIEPAVEAETLDFAPRKPR